MHQLVRMVLGHEHGQFMGQILDGPVVPGCWCEPDGGKAERLCHTAPPSQLIDSLQSMNRLNRVKLQQLEHVLGHAHNHTTAAATTIVAVTAQ
jgi:hypothetical protein